MEKHYVETTRIFQTSKLHRKTVRGNNADFSTIEIALKKAHGNDVDFSVSEITSNKYVEMTWKFVEIWSLTYQRNIRGKSTPIRSGVPVGKLLMQRYGLHIKTINPLKWNMMRR